MSAAAIAPLPDLRLHHVAYLVADTARTADVLRATGARIERLRWPLDVQRAWISFLDPGHGAPLIELVEPYPDNAVMQRRLTREGAGSGSVLYHLGYLTECFDAAFQAMRHQGQLPLTAPFEGMSPGARASHLYHPDFGILEIMEQAA